MGLPFSARRWTIGPMMPPGFPVTMVFLMGQQRPGRVLLAVGEAGFVGIERPAHGLEHNGFLPEQIGDKPGAVVIVDAEHL